MPLIPSTHDSCSLYCATATRSLLTARCAAIEWYVRSHSSVALACSSNLLCNSGMGCSVTCPPCCSLLVISVCSVVIFGLLVRLHRVQVELHRVA